MLLIVVTDAVADNHKQGDGDNAVRMDDCHFSRHFRRKRMSALPTVPNKAPVNPTVYPREGSIVLRVSRRIVDMLRS